jgi:hypothetical protein
MTVRNAESSTALTDNGISADGQQRSGKSLGWQSLERLQ